MSDTVNRYQVIKVNSTQEMVYATLRDEIIALSLKPGTVISTKETADRLGVSRTPVREAFIRLQSEGLLEVSHQRTTTVALIDLDRVRQERFIREALEVENLDLFIPNASEDALNLLDNTIRKQAAAVAQGRIVAYKDLDNDFHWQVFQETGEELSRDLVCQHNGHYERIRLITAWDKPIAENSIQEHRMLVEAYRQRDVEKAKKLLLIHLRRINAQEKWLLTKWPMYFKK